MKSTSSGNGRTRSNASKKRTSSGKWAAAVFVTGLLFVLAVVLLVSCVQQSHNHPPVSEQPSESVSADAPAASSPDPEESSRSYSAPSVIELIDPDAQSSEDEPDDPTPSETEPSKAPDSQTSKETSSPTETSKDSGKHEQPVFQGGDVVTPVNPTSEYVNIRTVTTPERNNLVVVGVDTEDPTVAEGIEKLNAIYSTYKNTTGFFAYSLDGKRAIAWNCENEFFSACTVKTGFILYCCLAIDQGLADKDTVMYYEAKYYHGGSGYIKNCEYGTSFTIERLIYLSLNVSDNIAYEMLTAFFGHDGYNKMMQDLGCERLQLDKSIWSYKMNAHDLAILWRELYFYFQTDSYMANLYRKATFNTKYNYATKKIDYDYNHKSGDSQASHPVINDGSIIWQNTRTSSRS